MEQLMYRLQFQDTPTSRRLGLKEWRPKDGDVLVATPPKSGTTLLLQMAHCLRSNGDTRFDEINKDCVPCLEMAFDAGVPLDLDQRYTPRLFKTHAWFPHIPGNDIETVKIVCVIRDPVKVAVSFYHFLGNGWFFSNDEIDIDMFIQQFVVKSRGAPKDYSENAGIFHIIQSYYEHRHDDRVLLLCYENLVKHKRVHTRKLAEFLGIPYDDELLDLVERLSSKEWMGAPENVKKFDEHFMKYAVNERAGLARNAGLQPGSTGKVRICKDDSQDRISDTTFEMLQRCWDDVLKPATGCSSYGELLEKLHGELYHGWF